MQQAALVCCKGFAISPVPGLVTQAYAKPSSQLPVSSAVCMKEHNGRGKTASKTSSRCEYRANASTEFRANDRMLPPGTWQVS